MSEDITEPLKSILKFFKKKILVTNLCDFLGENGKSFLATRNIDCFFASLTKTMSSSFYSQYRSS